MKDEIIKKLLDVKWNLVIMAAFCFLFAVYMYVTPVEGGLGMFMITPHNGLAGLLEMLPSIGIFLGAATFIASFVSKSTWVLGWTEPVLGALMFVAGFWELFFPYDIAVFSLTYAFVGIFLAFYVMFIALEMDRKGVGHWFMTLVLAAAIWAVSFFNMMNFAGEGAFRCPVLPGAVPGRLGLCLRRAGAFRRGSAEGFLPVPPRQEGQGRGVAASAFAVACLAGGGARLARIRAA